jgi:hypothetical protein
MLIREEKRDNLIYNFRRVLNVTIFIFLLYSLTNFFTNSGQGFVYRLLNFNFIYSAFGKSLCTYKRCWKWCPRASIQGWTRLILFANTFCRSAFGKSLFTYKRCWKWCPRVSIQAWTRLILFANTLCRSAFGKSLCTYTRCWQWCPRVNSATSRYRNPHSKVHNDFPNALYHSVWV